MRIRNISLISLLMLVVVFSADADRRRMMLKLRPAGGGGASTLNNGLIAYWKLDEASGTRNDSEPTGTAQNLTDNNTVTSAAGKISNAGDFEFDNQEYLSRADNADLSLGSDSDITVCAWVYLESKPAFAGGIVCKNDDSGNGAEYLLRWDAGADRFLFTIGDGASTASADATTFGSPSLSTWYFIVAWHDSSADRVRIQVNNGTVDESVPYTDGTQDGTAEFRIGAYSFNSGFAFDGLIDEVGIWNRVLTSDERTELYAGGSGKTCCGF